MNMIVHIEPRDVLAYLNRMGYRNISVDMLEAFVKDLKKLIKHDLKANQYQSSKSPGVSSVSSDTDNYSSGCSTSCYQADKDTEESCTSYLCEQDGKTENCCTSTEKNEVHIEKDAKESTEQKVQSKREKQKKHLNRVDHPRSSFIKPWQIEATRTQRRADPVALYHKYQSLWQQQKIPGDDARVGIRWSVREKMFGIDPQPKPIPHLERTTSKHKPGCMKGHSI